MRSPILHLALLFAAAPALAQQSKDQLHLKSSINQQITVYKGTVFVNGNKAFFLHDDVNYASRRNKLVEDAGAVFLFLEMARPPEKQMLVLRIDHSNADSVATSVLSDVKDFDHDGQLEFGGKAPVPPPPSADSTYYVPARFYEIKKGNITLDEAYTQQIEKKINGVYLATPYDAYGKPVVIRKK